MNKLSIRPRNLDACKYLPIYKCEEIPDLNDYASVNRSIPQLPTGMEKEEESEHHLQQAISAQQSKGTTGELVIPTPEVYDAPETFYNDLYPQNFKLSRQLIHVQPFAIEHDIPDYDRDSEDEQWIESQKDLPNLTPLKFEELIDRFDKSSSQHVVSLKEAKSLIKEDEDLIIAVYDYWLNKRLRLQTPLIPLVKTERRDTSTNNSNNPYIAFRRRTEKMQTRKNRKNDEISYEKMIKLKRDLSRSVNLLQLVKQREETKKEYVKLTVDIFEKRYLLGDFNGNIINEISALRQIRPPPNYLPLNNLLKTNENKPPRNKEDTPQPRKKREYRKRHRPEVVQRTTDQNDIHDYAFSSDEDDINDNLSQPVSDQEEDDSDGPYAFKRKKGCQYHAPLSDPLGNWPFYSAEEKASQKTVKKYCLAELRRSDKRIFGYARRRIGRGGRVIFDRAFDNKDQNIDMDSDSESYNYFRPKSPIFKNRTYSDSFDEDEDSNNDSLYIENGNLNSSVPINLNDYLHEQDNMFSNCKTSADEELSKFKSHQKELIEMQKRQKEKQNKYEVNENEDLNQISNSNNDIVNENSLKINLSTCNNIQSLVLKNHSLNSMANSTTCLNNTTSLPQSSTLDSESVQFAVSAVLSTVSSLNNSSSLYLNGPAQINNLEYEKIFSNFNQHSPSQNNSTQQFLSTQQQSQQNPQAQWSNQQSNELNNSSNVYKLKFQNNNQNSINSVEAKLTPTDVI